MVVMWGNHCIVVIPFLVWRIVTTRDFQTAGRWTLGGIYALIQSMALDDTTFMADRPQIIGALDLPSYPYLVAI